MAFKFLNDKIKVFISSKCGSYNEDYEIIRIGLKNLLEETGFIHTYVFEETTPSSMNIQEEYLNRLEDSDIILFLIDNERYNCSDGVMREWKHAITLQKKSIYLFYNDNAKDITNIQKELQKPNSNKWMTITNKKDFLEEGYKAIIEDIIRIYREYCKNRMMDRNSHKEYNNDNIVENNNLFFNKINKVEINENMINDFTIISEYFKSKNIFYEKEEESIENISDIEKRFLYFIKLLLCEVDYDESSIDNLIKLVSKSHVNIIKSIVQKRWNSIKCCYNDDVDKAIEYLNKAYDEALNNKIDMWIINDILIDKRYLENYIHNNRSNVYLFESETQKILNDNPDILYYPVLDRISKNIYNKLLKVINENNMDGPYTVRFGIELNEILEELSKYYILSVYYGSYIHMDIVRRLLKDIFYNFYNIYKNNFFGFEALRYSVLYSDLKTVKDICNRHSDIISTCSLNKINDLYSISNRISLTYQRKRVKLNIFSCLGYYFEENYYIKVEEEIFTIFDEWLYSERTVNDLDNMIFEAIINNISRININKTIVFLIRTIKNKKYVYIDKILEILKLINFNNVEEYNFKEIIDIISTIVKNKNMNVNYEYLKVLIIILRKSDLGYSETLDNLVENNFSDFNTVYKLNIFNREEDCYNEILKCIEEIKARNLKQESGIYVGYGYNPQDIIKNIIKDSDMLLCHYDLINPIATVCRDCLMNERQVIHEKISTIHLLIYLMYISKNKNLHFDWKKYYNGLFEVKVQKGFCEGFFNKESELTLFANYIFYKIINLDINKNEIMNLLGYYNNDNVYENIKILEVINIFIQNSYIGNIPENIYIILIQFVSRYINDNNYEVRSEAIDTFFAFFNKYNDELSLSFINQMGNDTDYRIKLIIIRNIKRQEENAFQYRDILEKYKLDNHYIVRCRAKKLLECNIYN